MHSRFLAGLYGLALILSLAGCGTTVPDPFNPSKTVTLTGNPLADFAPLAQKITVYATDDVKAALVDAQAQTPPDAVGAQCWATVLDALPLLQAPPGAAAAVALQKARDAERVAPLVVAACN